MIAHPHRSARRALKRSALALLAVFVLAQGAPSSMAAETTRNGDWFCERSEADGRWSCRRLSEDEKRDLDDSGLSPDEEQLQEAPAAADTSVTVDTSDELPEVYEREPVSAATDDDDSEPVYEAQYYETEPSETEPSETEASETEAYETEYIDSAADTAEVEAQQLVADPEPIPEPANRPEPTHARAPDYNPVQTGNVDERPAYQRLAYTPKEAISLLELPGDFWVAQLMAVSSKEFLEEYAAEHQLRGLSAARVASDDRLFYVLILGIYETKALAQEAISDLPPPYDRYSPFLRSLKSLQQAMRKADELAGGSQF